MRDYCNSCHWREIGECDENELCNGFQPNEELEEKLTNRLIEHGRAEFREEWFERLEEWFEDYE